LTSEIKPVQSQFSPSYSLAVNLIGRGEGKLDIARKLVQKSFAMWGKKQAEDKIAVMKDMYGDEFDEVLETAAQSRFLDTLKKLVMEKIEKKGAKAKVSHKRIVEVLDDKTLLKKESKTYTSLLQILALEQNTLQYLVKELDAALSNDAESQDIDGLEALFAEDVDGIQTEIERQKRRVRKSELELSDHIFTTMANVANGFLSNSSSNLVTDLYTTLALLKKNQHPDGIELRVSAEDLTFFAKSAVTVNRKRRKQKNVGEELGVDETSLVEQLGSFEVDTGDDSWDDMLALVDVLKAYGCIVPENDNIDDPE
jgi:transcriptional regulator of heat shock response